MSVSKWDMRIPHNNSSSPDDKDHSPWRVHSMALYPTDVPILPNLHHQISQEFPNLDLKVPSPISHWWPKRTWQPYKFTITRELLISGNNLECKPLEMLTVWNGTVYNSAQQSSPEFCFIPDIIQSSSYTTQHNASWALNILEKQLQLKPFQLRTVP